MATEFTGSYLIPAPRQKVWEALNDPAVLARCIPGCEALDATGPGSFRAAVALRIGVVGATFAGDVRLDPMDPPAQFRLAGEASGGLAGYAKGGAEVTLAETGPDETRLDYRAQADIGGRVAMVGGRLIQSVAASLADKFFASFAAEVGGGQPVKRLDGKGAVAPAAQEISNLPPSASRAPALGQPLTVGLVGAFLAGIGVGIVATVAAVIALGIAL